MPSKFIQKLSTVIHREKGLRNGINMVVHRVIHIIHKIVSIFEDKKTL